MSSTSSVPVPVPVPGIDPALSRGAFWLMLRRVAVLAAWVDFTLLFVFLALDLPALAWPNLISIAMYVAAYLLLGRRRNIPAVLLMWTEVLVHACVCTILVGWEAGNHYFLLVFLPAVALSRSPRLAAAALVFLLVVYLGLDALCQVIPPLYLLTPATATALRWISITLMFLMFGYTGRHYLQQVALAEWRLRQMATIDHLSGLSNRRHFLYKAAIEMERAGRYGQAFTVVLADIDHFKRVNDQYGHPAGDRVIQHIASLLLSHLRSMDLVGRWGGEEFIFLLPATPAEGAAQLCERLRECIDTTPCVVDGTSIHVAMSFGLHQVDLAAGLDAAVKQADVALYEAKALGRNRVVVATAAVG